MGFISTRYQVLYVSIEVILGGRKKNLKRMHSHLLLECVWFKKTA